MVSRLEKVMELGRPQTYTRIDIYNGAANMLCQRRGQALYDMIYRYLVEATDVQPNSLQTYHIVQS